MRSYTTEDRGLTQLIREARHLAANFTDDVPNEVGRMLDRLSDVERLTAERLGLQLEGREMLDVGAGQLLLQMRYFAQRNEVVGIDANVIVHGLDLRGYREMLRVNGVKRVIKTAGRKLLQIDARYYRELARRTGAGRNPLRVFRMDAAEMDFDDASFDFVYSLAVFQHLENPAAVLKEMVRVLRPRGGLYFDFVLYTGRTGSHDVRQFVGADEDIPAWAHLRPRFRTLVRPNAYLNELRLSAWRDIFAEQIPGYEIELYGSWDSHVLVQEAEALIRGGELDGYSSEELLTSKVAVLWRKPDPTQLL